MSKYDIKLTDLRLDTDELNRDNYVAIQETLRLIKEALDDIDNRIANENS